MIRSLRAWRRGCCAHSYAPRLKSKYWFAMLALSMAFAAAAHAQSTSVRGEELKFVVILSRHGVRPPTWSAEQLNQYSTSAWPNWGVPPGYLTSHGKKLMQIFGAYDRAYFAQAGLLNSQGCSDAEGVYFWADNEERTLETGRALAKGMFPGCSVEVHSLSAGKHDPLFSPSKAEIKPSDLRLSEAAVAGRMGGNPRALEELYRPQLQLMQRVLLGCKAESPCPTAASLGKKSLFEGPATPSSMGGDHPGWLPHSIQLGATFSEDFLLEYANGMTGQDLGWGRLDEAKVRELMALHAVSADLMRQTPTIARVRASNLLDHILKTLEQSVSGKAVSGALGKPGDRVLVVVGHDTNISNIAGTLGLSWLIQGFQRDDTPPGGALVFELWSEPASGGYDVRTYYTTQTMEQMHKALPLTLATPPARAPIFIPGCSTAGEALACDWTGFQRTLQAAIDPAFVKP